MEFIIWLLGEKRLSCMFVCLTIKITKKTCKCLPILYSKAKEIQLSEFKKIVLSNEVNIFSQFSD